MNGNGNVNVNLSFRRNVKDGCIVLYSYYTFDPYFNLSVPEGENTLNVGSTIHNYTSIQENGLKKDKLINSI